jgi:hypothetical protein
MRSIISKVVCRPLNGKHAIAIWTLRPTFRNSDSKALELSLRIFIVSNIPKQLPHKLSWRPSGDATFTSLPALESVMLCLQGRNCYMVKRAWALQSQANPRSTSLTIDSHLLMRIKWDYNDWNKTEKPSSSALNPVNYKCWSFYFMRV